MMGNTYGLLSVSVLKIQDDPATWEAMLWQRGGQPMRFYGGSRDEALKQVGRHLVALGDVVAGDLLQAAEVAA